MHRISIKLGCNMRYWIRRWVNCVRNSIFKNRRSYTDIDEVTLKSGVMEVLDKGFKACRRCVRFELKILTKIFDRIWCIWKKIRKRKSMFLKKNILWNMYSATRWYKYIYIYVCVCVCVRACYLCVTLSEERIREDELNMNWKILLSPIAH